jgi:hypothetical protein
MLCMFDTSPDISGISKRGYSADISVIPPKHFATHRFYLRTARKVFRFNYRPIGRYICLLSKLVSFPSFFPVAQEPKSGLGRLVLEVSRSHSDTPHSVGLLWTSDQSVAETCLHQIRKWGVHCFRQRRKLCKAGHFLYVVHRAYYELLRQTNKYARVGVTLIQYNTPLWIVCIFGRFVLIIRQVMYEKCNIVALSRNVHAPSTIRTAWCRIIQRDCFRDDLMSRARKNPT